MTPAHKYARFAWIVPYIREIRLCDSYAEFSFPPGSIEDMETLREMLGGNCTEGVELTRTTTI